MSRDYRWDKIGIMGGELTTHPFLEVMLDVIYQYKKDYPSCHVWCMTNGIIDYAFPEWIEVIRNTDHLHHHAFYVSPLDVNFAMNKRTCHVLHDCGMGYSIHGFTPCCNTNAIIRAFNLIDGVQNLSDVTYESMMKLCGFYCKYCGWYMMDDFDHGPLLEYPVTYMSESWKLAKEKYDKLTL
jgi:hypothetical protein